MTFFDRAYIVENFEEFRKKITKQFSSRGKRSPKWQDFSGFVRENLIDNIKIIICFENYLKSKLIEEGYFVHRFNKEKIQALKTHNLNTTPLRA